MKLSEKFPEKFPYFVEACINELARFVIAPKEELVAIIDTFFEEFDDELENFDYDENTENRYMDTAPREILHDAFARYLTGMNWPCYGNTREYTNEFFAAFEEAVAAQGWQISKDF